VKIVIVVAADAREEVAENTIQRRSTTKTQRKKKGRTFDIHSIIIAQIFVFER
jgi:hypothetical protein